MDEGGGSPSFKTYGPAGTAEVFFRGAQIVEWTPKGQAPVLWRGSRLPLPDTGPVRGGIPICLPWFGGTAAPRHGFGRLVPWQLTCVEHAPDRIALTFQLVYRPTVANMSWPHSFVARFQATFGETLAMTLQVTHLGDAPAQYEPALHPYIRVGDVTRIRISGLEGAFTDATEPAQGTPELAFDERGIDRIYQCSTPVTVHDDVNHRDIVIESPSAGSRIIWNPGSAGSRAVPDLGEHDWQSFLCIEPGNIRENAITLIPGEQHSFTSTIRVVPRT